MIEQAQDIAEAFAILGPLGYAAIMTAMWWFEKKEHRDTRQMLYRFLKVVESKDDSTK